MNPPQSKPVRKTTYMLNQRPLVFKSITLAQVIEFVVKVLVNLARVTILY
jgi:hypothetical protein